MVREEPDLIGTITEPKIKALYRNLEALYRAADLPAHGFDHLKRVYQNAMAIGESEGCRLNIVGPAALLHDLGFLADSNPAGHHRRGAEMCLEWLDDWTPSEQSEIAACVLKHKGATPGFLTAPESLEEMVICDADSLEKIGHLGLVQGVRTYVEFSSFHTEYRSIEYSLENMAKLPEQIFYTCKGTAISESRGGGALRANLCRAALAQIRSVAAPEQDIRISVI